MHDRMRSGVQDSEELTAVWTRSFHAHLGFELAGDQVVALLCLRYIIGGL